MGQKVLVIHLWIQVNAVRGGAEDLERRGLQRFRGSKTGGPVRLIQRLGWFLSAES